MNAFDLKDPKTKKMLMYGLPVVAVVAYVVLRKKSAAPTSTTSPITSGGNLGAGQISDLQQGYSNGFNQLQSQLNTLAGMMGTGSSPSTPSGSPTGSTATTTTISGPAPAAASTPAPAAALEPWQAAGGFAPTPAGYVASPIVVQGQTIGESFTNPSVPTGAAMPGYSPGPVGTHEVPIIVQGQQIGVSIVPN